MFFRRKTLLFTLILVMLIFTISFSESNNKLSFTTSQNAFIVWNSDYLVLTGKATVTYKKTTIIATNFFYDIKENSFYITSEATFLENKDMWKSNKMVYDVDQDELYLFNVKGQSKQKNPNTKKYFKAYYFTDYLFGDQYNDKRRFSTDGGYFTTCDPRKPHFLDYRIKASKIYIYPKDYLIAYNVIMYIGFIPVYYFPVYYFPLNGNANQPIDFTYKTDSTNGIMIHIGLNYNLGGKGKDGGVYYDYVQKSATQMGIHQDYFEKDLKFNVKYDIRNDINKKISNWFQLSYSQKPWNLFSVNSKFMTSNSSDSSVFNTGKIQKYINVVSLNQPFKYSVKLSSMQNIKYEIPTDTPTTAEENPTKFPTTTVDDSQIFPQITFNYNNKNNDNFSISKLSFLYKKTKNITTTTSPQASDLVTDYYNSNLNFSTDFYLFSGVSCGYRYLNSDSNIYSRIGLSESNTTQTSSSIKNYYYLKYSFNYFDTYLSYEDNLVNSNAYKLVSGNLNLKYKLNPFNGNILAKFGRTLLNDKYTVSLDFKNKTKYYNFRYKKTLSNIPGLPKTDYALLRSNFSTPAMKTNLTLNYVKNEYNVSKATTENVNFSVNSKILKRLSINSKINYDMINKKSLNPYIFSDLIFSPFYLKLKYYMNSDLSFYKLQFYSRYSMKNLIFKNSNLYFDFSTYLNSNYKFGQSKVYLKYNISKILSFSSSAFYYPDTNSWNNFLISSSIFFIPGWNFNINTSYSNHQWNDFKLNFVEDLSCWNGFGSIEYSNSGGWHFKQFMIGLYIKAFPKKPYKLDPVNGKFEIGGF